MGILQIHSEGLWNVRKLHTSDGQNKNNIALMKESVTKLDKLLTDEQNIYHKSTITIGS